MTGEDIRNQREKLGLTQVELAKRIGVALRTINNYESGGNIPASKFEILRIALSEDYVRPDEATAVENPNVVHVPLIGQYAHAGYLCGFADEHYVRALPTLPFMVDRELKGRYLAFEVKGDSMDDGSRDSLVEGDKLICRQIRSDLWQYKLHYNDWDFVIVHKTEGILVKRIIAHDVEHGKITIHSLNPMYEDNTLSLNDVAHLCNVIEVMRKGRR